MRLNKQSISPVARLARGYAAAAPKPDVEYEAESSTAAQRRQQASPENPKPSRPTTFNNGSKLRRGPKAMSLLRAQKFAQALQDIPTPSKMDIKQTGTQATPPPPPTLADLEAKRPVRPPPPITHRNYGTLYHRLFLSIDKAFVSQQLLPFARKMGVKIRRGRGKDVAVRGILKIWGWEDPDSYEPDQSSEKVRERDWNLTKAELWLIMRDVSCIKPALDEDVKFSIPSSTTGEMEIKVDTGMKTLHGSGAAPVLQELNQRIVDRKASIMQHTRLFSPGPSGVEKRLGILSTISNASGAYLEPILGGSIRVSALAPTQASIAISLLEQHRSYTLAQSKIPFNLIAPSPTLEMSLFPHIPSSIGSIPWQSIDQLSQPLLRLRGVQTWETKVGMRGVAHKEEKMDQSGSYRISNPGTVSESQTLSAKISESLQIGENSTTIARFGHLLFSDPTSNASMLSPEDNSRFTAENLSGSSVTRTKAVLLPSLPPALIQYPIEASARTVRVLRYQSQVQPGQFCDISYTVPTPTSTSNATTTNPEVPVERESGWHQELDDMMGRLEVEDLPEEAESAEKITRAEQVTPAESTTVKEVEKDLLGFQMGIIREKSENFISPDRPIDFTMISSDAQHFGTDLIPTSVIDYLRNREGQAPSSLDLHDQTWTLVSAVQKTITESNLSFPTSQAASETAQSKPNVILRSIQSTDLTFGQERVIRCAELETRGEISPVFWEQLATWTRAVAPGAGSLRTAVY